MRVPPRSVTILASLGLALLFAARAHAQDLTGTTWVLTSHNPADFVFNANIPGDEVGLGLIILRGRPGEPVLMVTKGNEEDPEKYGWDGTYDGTRLTFRKRLVNPNANETFTFDGQVSADGIRISGTFRYYIKSYLADENLSDAVVYTREGTFAPGTSTTTPDPGTGAPSAATNDPPGVPPAPRLGPTDSPSSTPADFGTGVVPVVTNTSPVGGLLGWIAIIMALAGAAVLVKAKTAKKLTPCQQALQEFWNRRDAYKARVQAIRDNWMSQSGNLRAEIGRMDARRKQLMEETQALQAAIKSNERQAFALTSKIFLYGKTGGIIKEFGRFEAIKKLYELSQAARKVGAAATAAEGAAGGAATGSPGGLVGAGVGALAGAVVAFGIYIAAEALEDAVTEMVAGDNIRALEKELGKVQEVMSDKHPGMLTTIQHNEWSFRDLSDKRPELIRQHRNLTLQANAEFGATHKLLVSAHAHALQVCGDITVSAPEPEADPIEEPDLSDPLQSWWGSLWAEPTDVVMKF